MVYRCVIFNPCITACQFSVNSFKPSQRPWDVYSQLEFVCPRRQRHTFRMLDKEGPYPYLISILGGCRLILPTYSQDLTSQSLQAQFIFEPKKITYNRRTLYDMLTGRMSPGLSMSNTPPLLTRPIWLMSQCKYRWGYCIIVQAGATLQRPIGQMGFGRLGRLIGFTIDAWYILQISGSVSSAYTQSKSTHGKLQ